MQINEKIMQIISKFMQLTKKFRIHAKIKNPSLHFSHKDQHKDV